jgi:hypothetical protein
MHATSLAYAGDVTALCIAHCSIINDNLVLFGLGAQLHVHLLTSGERLLCQTVLPFGIRIHGIYGIEWGQGLLLLVHGDRHVNLVGLDPAGRTLRPVCQLPRFYQWTVAVHASIAPNGIAVVAVGLSDNSLEAFHLALPPAPALAPAPAVGATAPGGAASSATGLGPAGPLRAERVLRVESMERCLLFSMALHPRAEVRQLGGPPSSLAAPLETACLLCRTMCHHSQALCVLTTTGRGRDSPSLFRSNACDLTSLQLPFWLIIALPPPPVCLQPGGAVSYLVACGTIFLDVVVWETPPIRLAGPALLGGQPERDLVADTLYRLKGHRGAIHRRGWLLHFFRCFWLDCVEGPGRDVLIFGLKAMIIHEGQACMPESVVLCLTRGIQGQEKPCTASCALQLHHHNCCHNCPRTCQTRPGQNVVTI